MIRSVSRTNINQKIRIPITIFLLVHTREIKRQTQEKMKKISKTYSQIYQLLQKWDYVLAVMDGDSYDVKLWGLGSLPQTP